MAIEIKGLRTEVRQFQLQNQAKVVKVNYLDQPTIQTVTRSHAHSMDLQLQESKEAGESTEEKTQIPKKSSLLNLCESRRSTCEKELEEA
jgi:hypothetical protein